MSADPAPEQGSTQHFLEETMKRRSVAILGVLGFAVGGIIVASAVGNRAWNRETRDMVRRVDGIRAGHNLRYDPDDLRDLPAPVARYFETVLTPGQPHVRGARIEHSGDFRTGLEARWSPFHSVQHFSARPPAFVWDAKIRMAPLTSVRVRDHYLGGAAGMLGRVAGIVTVVDESNSATLASGALHRAFAERPWLPTSLLPSEGVRWEAVDDSTARASLSDSGITVEMDVHFASDGTIERVEMLRYRDVDGVGVRTPFVGRFRDFQRVEGMMIPMEGEVEWLLPEGRLNYWRGRIVKVEYDFGE
jgi:hypothetical protein